jgi:hypothetical protein
MKLPTEKSKITTNPFEFTILLYGEPKIGKSEACARIPDALFIPTEAGLKNLSVYKTDLVKTWKEFGDIALKIEEENHPFKTIVIDTIDGMYRLCADHICNQWGWKHESEPDNYGQSYALIKQEFMRVLNKLASLPTGLVLVGHSRIKEMKNRVGKKYNKVSLAFSEKVEEEIAAFVDISLYCCIENIDDKKLRIVHSLTSDNYFAGGRSNMFEDGSLLSDLFNQKKGGKK